MNRFVAVIVITCKCVLLDAQTITTFAGNGCTGPSSGDGIPATAACIGYAGGGSFDSVGNYYFGQDFGASKVKKIGITGIIVNVAGNGSSGFSGDGGLATNAAISYPLAISDAAGNIYIADRDNHRVRKVNASTGVITTIAGNGMGGHSGDGGPATAATLWPCWLCIDTYGNIFVNDSSTWIRRISTTGLITTIAGNGILGVSGDGGPATAAALGGTSMCADSIGNLFVGCTGRIRKIDITSGIINTIAGNGVAAPYSGDGPASAAQFIAYAVAIDRLGNLFIADYGVGNSRILKLDTSGYVRSIAGTGTDGFSGDGGAATNAQIHNPEGVAIDLCGNVYIADDANRRIRKITYPPMFITPVISLSGVATVAVGSTVSVNATVASAGSSYIVHWMNHGIEFTTTTGLVVTYTKTPGIDTITARVVSTATYGCYDSTTSAGHIVSTPSTGIGLVGSSSCFVYPNPATDLLHIDAADKISDVTICNLLGQVVLLKEVYAETARLNVAHLPAGLYLVKVRAMNGMQMVTRMTKN